MTNTNPRDTSDTLGQIDPNWESVAVGAPVVASDGRTIGTVDAKRSDGLHRTSGAPISRSTW